MFKKFRVALRFYRALVYLCVAVKLDGVADWDWSTVFSPLLILSLMSSMIALALMSVFNVEGTGLPLQFCVWMFLVILYMIFLSIASYISLLYYFELKKRVHIPFALQLLIGSTLTFTLLTLCSRQVIM